MVLPLFAHQLLAHQTPSEQHGTLEVLQGFERDSHQLRILVKSNGCTQVKDFRVHVHDKQLSIYRIKPDWCRGKTHMVWLNLPSFVAADAKGANFMVRNTFNYFDKTTK